MSPPPEISPLTRSGSKRERFSFRRSHSSGGQQSTSAPIVAATVPEGEAVVRYSRSTSTRQ